MCGLQSTSVQEDISIQYSIVAIINGLQSLQKAKFLSETPQH